MGSIVFKSSDFGFGTRARRKEGGREGEKEGRGGRWGKGGKERGQGEGWNEHREHGS